MNMRRKIIITACLLVLRPGFAYGYTGELPFIHSLLTWLMWGLFAGLYFLPSIYYVLRYRRCSLSINSLLIPHLAFISLFLMGIYHYELGLSPLLLKMMNYISVTVVFIVFCGLALLLWAYPAFYAYNREVKLQQT
ncbi:hypothetical protein [Acinetobacter rudis]|uniref:Uncharacterized protein n=1 Tax=Acinetobacter rudis CIP 110305 TaxID=421052 RepID=S3MUK3_9GAMM|nr:hypothetical protein [Acinetobacter rudis]EPF70233.1 hypothetical protein F945_03252 [Acinetobacter rudis CIP 110305]